jgi:hypothetical protein
VIASADACISSWLSDEGRAEQERQVVGEALARPAAVDDQRLDHVRGDEREEHVAGRLGGPPAGELALVTEAPGQTPAVCELFSDDPFAVRGGVGVEAPDALDGAVDGEQARVIAGEVRRPSIERADRAGRLPDFA